MVSVSFLVFSMSFVSVSFSFLRSRLWNSCYDCLVRFLFRASRSFCLCLFPDSIYCLTLDMFLMLTYFSCL